MFQPKERHPVTISSPSGFDRIILFFESKLQGDLSFSEHRFEVAKRISSLLNHKKAARICIRRADKLLTCPSTEAKQKLAKKMLLFAEQCYTKIDFKEQEKYKQKLNLLLSYVKNIELAEEDLKEIMTTELKLVYEFQRW